MNRKFCVFNLVSRVSFKFRKSLNSSSPPGVAVQSAQLPWCPRQDRVILWSNNITCPGRKYLFVKLRIWESKVCQPPRVLCLSIQVYTDICMEIVPSIFPVYAVASMKVQILTNDKRHSSNSSCWRDTNHVTSTIDYITRKVFHKRAQREL